jgi:hypothetical protein
MRKALFLALILPASPGAGTPPPVQSAPAAAEPARCERPHADYEKMLKRLAASTAEGAFRGGKSPRLRITEERSLISLAAITAETLGSSGCVAPDYPPSGEPYLLAAMKCEKARRAARAGAAPPACDMAQWKPYAE